MKTNLQMLVGKVLEDIILRGVVDLDDDPAEFVPLMDRIYLLIGDSLLSLWAQESDNNLAFEFVEAIQSSSDLEETQVGCRSSVGKYTLLNPLADNRISEITLYQSTPEHYSAIELTLFSGQVLFFDPSFFDGINFGGPDQKALWQANAPQCDAITIR